MFRFSLPGKRSDGERKEKGSYVRLQAMMDSEELDGNQTGTIMLYIRDVLDKLTGKRENVRKGVEDYMGG